MGQPSDRAAADYAPEESRRAVAGAEDLPAAHPVDRAQAAHPVDRAHLTSRSRPTPPIYRYHPPPQLVDLVQWFWVPVWSLPEPQTQSTLQHPSALIVISNTYARFYGVAPGQSSITLEGDGYAVGAMLTPGAGYLIAGDMNRYTGRHADLARLPTLDKTTAGVRAAMSVDPHSPDAHQEAIAAVEAGLAPLAPMDADGRVVQAVVDWVYAHPESGRVTELAAAVGLTERTLQRLVERRLGLSPKWLIQRRRLHLAVEQIKQDPAISIGDLAAELGYSDQAHFTRDFRAATGRTPGEYRDDQ